MLESSLQGSFAIAAVFNQSKRGAGGTGPGKEHVLAAYLHGLDKLKYKGKGVNGATDAYLKRRSHRKRNSPKFALLI